MCGRNQGLHFLPSEVSVIAWDEERCILAVDAASAYTRRTRSYSVFANAGGSLSGLVAGPFTRIGPVPEHGRQA